MSRDDTAQILGRKSKIQVHRFTHPPSNVIQTRDDPAMVSSCTTWATPFGGRVLGTLELDVHYRGDYL